MDNTLINTGTGGDTIRSTDIGGVKSQHAKIEFGGTGVATQVSNGNPLPTSILSLPAEGAVSIGNSSAVNLAANAVFTGTSEDISLYSNIKINIYSSHVSATDGLSYQQSHDGVVWFSSQDVFTIPALTIKNFSAPVNMKFFRLVYTNGATLTTSLVIQVLYHKSNKQSSSVRPQDARSNENDFIEQLSFLMGFNGTSWDRLRSTIANGLAVDVTRLPALVAGSNAIGNINELRAATLTVTVTAATGVAATLTLPAVVGQFHYITSLQIRIYATALRTGVAAPLVVTTTNLPGSPAFTFETAQAIGTNTPVQGLDLATPLKSSVVNTATTIVAPIAATGIWRITATYFTGA